MIWAARLLLCLLPLHALAWPLVQVDGEILDSATLDAAMPDKVGAIRGDIARHLKEACLALAGRGARAQGKDFQQGLLAWRQGQQALAGVELLAAGEQLDRPLPAEQLLCRLGEQGFTAGRVEATRALPLYRLRGELQLARQARFDDWLQAKLVTRLAKRQGVSTAQWQAGFDKPVSDAEVNAYLAAHPDKQLSKQQVRSFLAFTRGYEAKARQLAREKAKVKVRWLNQMPQPPRIELPERWRQGAELVVFSNLSCQSCRALIAEIAQQAPAALDWRLHQYLPGPDPVGRALAGRVLCAADPVAERRHWLARPRPQTPPPFACPQLDQALLASWQQVRELGLDRPPVIWVKGQVLSGYQPWENIQALLEAP
ncbi:hypothetical protein [Gallaecimonas sp. GXIMD4217]|uniref:hypothetical protein n=1 Tax=Gallaecimonas sp. GXIMD4217 TaxID=3131927 RepID=UPI00311B31B5